MPTPPPLTHDFDSFWKEALDTFLPEFLLLVVQKEVHAAVDWGKGFKPLDTELQPLFPDGKKGRRFVDRVYEVTLTGGAKKHLAIHIEIQVGKDGSIIWRAFAYSFRLREKLGYDVYTIVVLADDDPNFRPAALDATTFDQRLVFRVPIVKLTDFRGRFEQLRGDRNPFALLIIAWLGTRATAPDRQRVAFKTRLVRLLRDRHYGKARIRHVFKLVDSLVRLPEPLQRHFESHARRVRGEHRMPLISPMEQRILNQGRKEGREEGREEGLAKGQRDAIVRVLEARFGPPPDSLREDLSRITVGERLQSLVALAATARDLGEFLSGIGE